MNHPGGAPRGEPVGGCALVAECAFLLGSLPDAFVFDVADGRPEQWGHGVVVGEVSAIFDDLLELVVNPTAALSR